ncbi:MAG: adenylate/guanylate cyclase domain-containing protein [Acidimicrobiia bacterium]
MRSDLRSFLLDAGASEDDMARAETEGWLALLALDRLASPGAATHAIADVAALADTDEERLRRLWRAVGFPDVPDGLAVYTDADVEAARQVMHGAFARRSDFATVLRQVRVISSSMSRVASVLAEYYGNEVRDLREQGFTDEAAACAVIDDFDGDELAALVVHAARLQLRAALWRRLGRDLVPETAVAIGFADLSGYTQLSAELDADRLAAFVGRWEAVAYDTVAQHGGRVVKTIGDEVMFVGLSLQVARTAIALRDGAHAHELPPVRSGIAAGMVVARDGDFYGPVVNLASRLTEIASAGVIYASDALHEELAAVSSLVWSEVERRELRSIGSVAVFSLLGESETST